VVLTLNQVIISGEPNTPPPAPGHIKTYKITGEIVNQLFSIFYNISKNKELERIADDLTKHSEMPFEVGKRK
jgi:hypothetical protein